MLFSLNVLDEMQDKFGGYDLMPEALQGKDGIKNLKWLLALVINEGAGEDEEPVTAEQIGRMVHTGNIMSIKNAMFAAFAIGVTGDEEPEAEQPDDTDDTDEPDDGEGEGKNAAGAQDE